MYNGGIRNSMKSLIIFTIRLSSFSSKSVAIVRDTSHEETFFSSRFARLL